LNEEKSACNESTYSPLSLNTKLSYDETSISRYNSSGSTTSNSSNELPVATDNLSISSVNNYVNGTTVAYGIVNNNTIINITLANIPQYGMHVIVKQLQHLQLQH